MTSDEWAAISAIATGLGAIASAAVCYATFKILGATQQTLADARAAVEKSRRPVIEVAAWPKPNAPVLMLSIRNTGNGTARNVKFTLDQNFYFNGEQSNENNLRNYSVFKDTIVAVAPGTEINLMLGVGHTIYKNPEFCPDKFNVEVRYSFDQFQSVERIAVDLAPFRKHLAAEDEQLAQLRKLTSGIERIAKEISSQEIITSAAEFRDAINNPTRD